MLFSKQQLGKPAACFYGIAFVAKLDTSDDESGEPAVSLPLADLEITGVALVPGDQELATLGADATLRVFDADQLSSLGELAVPGAQRIAAHASGEVLLTTGDDGMMRMFGCE